MSQRREVLRALRRDRGSWIGGGLLAIVILMALAAPLAPYHPTERDRTAGLAGPSAEHWLGTDGASYDVLSRLLHGARLTLWTGLAAVGLALFVGVPLGALSGYAGGRTDLLLMRGVDVMLAFPSIVLAIGIAAILGRGLATVIVAVGVVNVPVVARQVRASVLQVRELEYVTAARAMGFGACRILARHVLPNCMAPIIVLSTLGVGFAILSAAGLNFLGLGPETRVAEWGVMLNEVRQHVLNGEWWVYVPPGSAIAITVLGFNLLGDGLRKALDPRVRGAAPAATMPEE